jgi:hypothetical protein
MKMNIKTLKRAADGLVFFAIQKSHTEVWVAERIGNYFSCAAMGHKEKIFSSSA